MVPLGTLLIVSRAGAEWSSVSDMLSDEYGYRILSARSHCDAAAALADAHVDFVIAEDGGNAAGLNFLAGLRTSHPDVIRVLALEADAAVSASAVLASSIYQILRKPLDSEQICLLVKRGLEARELARRHRLLSREFKVSSDGLIHKGHHGLGLRAESQRFEKLVFVSEMTQPRLY